MMFAIFYRWKSHASEEDVRSMRDLFMAWNPPAGVELKGHYYFARGGGLVIVDCASAASLYEGLAPFEGILDFDIEPVLNVIEAIAISLDVDEWKESVAAREAPSGTRGGESVPNFPFWSRDG